MSRDFSLFLVIVASMVATIWAECPNACSAHGKCGAYDMCTCYRNWMAADCSERICQFGMAHVDIPKGDLDASGDALTMGNVVVNDFIYPYGTTELYASQMDVDGNILENTAHEYRECSAKGICDRSTGTCACFEGYEGSACQRASCPTGAGGVCSGHGTCHTIKELAAMDNDNVYKLWDEHSTMGCNCDAGYSGPDCSSRMCKVGVDPLYQDNNATIRYSNWTYGIYTTAAATVTGNYSIIFYDAYGNDWQTAPIDIAADCDTITDALESLPNKVIPANSVRCYKYQTGTLASDGLSEVSDSNMIMAAKYTIAFSRNPGKLPQPKINIHLDGTRATLYSDEATSTLGTFIFPNGFTGEDTDHVNHRCFGVSVNISPDNAASPSYYYLNGMTNAQERLLKSCLGDSTGSDTDNINADVYNWDYGTDNNPHLIKLQDATQYKLPLINDDDGDEEVDWAIHVMPKTTLCTTIEGNQKRFGVDAYGNGFCSDRDRPGFYAVVYYTGSIFRLFTNPGKDYDTTTPFYVYTTSGYLQRVSTDAKVFNIVSGYSAYQKAVQTHNNILYMANASSTYTNYFGDMACENYATGEDGLMDCLNKGDKIMVLATTAANNVRYPNIYTVAKISNEEKSYNYKYSTMPTDEQYRLRIYLDTSVNFRYSWDETAPSTTGAYVYKFYEKNPTKSSRPNYGGYNYAGACSRRGNCDGDTGLCQCFNGYTSDNCGTMNALAQ